jgi:hydrogenase maturation protease
VSSAAGDSHSPPAEGVPALRVLCLGNELLGDDALGCVVAERLQPFASKDVDILCTPESGFYLLDCVLNVRRLVVVDTVQTGNAPPGTIYRFRDSELPLVSGGSPHYVGLCESLALGRTLGLAVAEKVIILAVEAGDSLTIGAEMSPEVRSIIPALLRMIRDMMPTAQDHKSGDAIVRQHHPFERILLWPWFQARSAYHGLVFEVKRETHTYEETYTRRSL